VVVVGARWWVVEVTWASTWGARRGGSSTQGGGGGRQYDVGSSLSMRPARWRSSSIRRRVAVVVVDARCGGVAVL